MSNTKKILSSDQKSAMDKVVENCPKDNKSQKIRTLYAADYKQGDIARFLGIIPQFVSNVVNRPLKSK